MYVNFETDNRLGYNFDNTKSDRLIEVHAEETLLLNHNSRESMKRKDGVWSPGALNTQTIRSNYY